MPGSLFAESSAAFKAALAGQMGCVLADYDSHTLTVVQRPPDSRERHLALMTTCGTGSVVSTRDPGLAEWARAQKLEAHFRVFLPAFLEAMAARARELGHEGAKSHSPSTGMVLAKAPEARALPPAYTLKELSLAEQASLRSGEVFDNALASPNEARRISATRIVFAAVLPAGEIAAIAGVWDQYPGIDEIGVDVARAHRGAGLASALTIYATRWIRSQGRWPIYTYGFSNMRSANTGLSAGYRPLWQLAAVFVPEDMR